MEINSDRGTCVIVQQVPKANHIFDNPIADSATLIVDLVAYSAMFNYPEKPEIFKIHIEMFLTLDPKNTDFIEINIAPNIQTSKFIEFPNEVVEEVQEFSYKLQDFYIVHFLENNSNDIVYNTIVDAIKACNNPIYSIFYYERNFHINIGNKQFIFLCKKNG